MARHRPIQRLFDFSRKPEENAAQPGGSQDDVQDDGAGAAGGAPADAREAPPAADLDADAGPLFRAAARLARGLDGPAEPAGAAAGPGVGRGAGAGPPGPAGAVGGGGPGGRTAEPGRRDQP